MTSTTEKSKKSFWGKGIFLFYGLFVLFTLAIVFIAVFQDFHLVENDYYQKELAYQSRIDEINNANRLPEKPVWVINQTEKILTIKFPESIMDSIVSGNILLYKTSQAGEDMIVKLVPDASGLQLIPLERLNRGLWKIKLDWQDSNQSYFLEGKFAIE